MENDGKRKCENVINNERGHKREYRNRKGITHDKSH